MINLVCTKCLKEMKASRVARYMHPEEKEERIKDTDGHHISINAKRTWCDGEWLEYTEKENFGMPFGGGFVQKTRWTLADGRVLERSYDSRKDVKVHMNIWSSVAACHRSSEEEK